MIKPIVTMGDDGDLGQAIQALITDNLSRLSTCFLAKVEKVEENKVDVSFVMGESKLVIPSILVGIPQATSYKHSMKLQVGDVGLCLVCDSDISVFKESGGGGKPATERYHDIIDSIFIPLSLYQSVLENNSIESEEILSIKAKKDLILQGKLISLKSENASLKEALSKLAEILAGLQTIPAVQGSMLTLNPDAIVKINQWKAELDTLFKE